MQIRSGDGSQSYRRCISSDCERLPTNVLSGRHPRLYTIQILYCNAH